jgi:hypothetical protein
MAKIMNKLRFLFFILGISGTLFSQTDKGTWLLGGSGGFLRANKSNAFTLNPTVGYFVFRHVAGGAQLNLIALKGGSSFSLGPFAKYYFYGDERGRFYGSLGLNIGDATNTAFDTGYSFGAGYAAFLNESVVIDIGLNYNKVGSTGHIFFLGGGFQIHFLRLKG